MKFLKPVLSTESSVPEVDLTHYVYIDLKSPKIMSYMIIFIGFFLSKVKNRSQVFIEGDLNVNTLSTSSPPEEFIMNER